MNEEEAINILIELSTFDYVKLENGDKAIETILNLIEKQQTKIKLLEDDLYSANGTINEYKERIEKAIRMLEE